jgi:hypothetical protein
VAGFDGPPEDPWDVMAYTFAWEGATTPEVGLKVLQGLSLPIVREVHDKLMTMQHSKKYDALWEQLCSKCAQLVDELTDPSWPMLDTGGPGTITGYYDMGPVAPKFLPNSRYHSFDEYIALKYGSSQANTDSSEESFL